jgi:transposase
MSQNPSSAVDVIGIDIGKNSFHVVGLDRRGAIVLRQKWSRSQAEARLANMPPCLIGMEACVGAHHLSRKLKAFGHDARLMPAKYVRPYSKGQKNDFRDAEAIAEAVQRPTMRFVATKTVEQLDLQALHRVRERLVSQRTGVINQIRAFLLERGVARQGQRFLRAEPIQLFWSVTLYDVDTRALILNDQRIADRSSRMDLRKNADGSVDIYCGPNAPPGTLPLLRQPHSAPPRRCESRTRLPAQSKANILFILVDNLGYGESQDI